MEHLRWLLLPELDPFRANALIYFTAFQYYAAHFSSITQQGFLMISEGIQVCCRILESIEINGNIDTKWLNLLYYRFFIH